MKASLLYRIALFFCCFLPSDIHLGFVKPIQNGSKLAY
jgi:hypothetical protein